MMEKPMDVLHLFPVRKNKQQKQVFREAVSAYLRTLGYEPKEEKGGRGCCNLVFGDPENAKYLVTAHYDTCARMPIPNFITPCNFWAFMGYQLLMTCFMLLVPVLPGVLAGVLAGSKQVGFWVWYLCFWVTYALMLFGPGNRSNANDNTSGVVTVLEIAAALPPEKRGDVCFVLFDLEEAGLIGSATHRKRYKKVTQNQIVLNLDCVGDGDEIVLFPTKKLSKEPDKLQLFESLCAVQGHKSLSLHRKGFSVYPSDQRNFPFGLGIAAFHRGRHIGLYCGRIHTHRDTILEYENVEFLRNRLVHFLQTAVCREVSV